MKLPQRVRRQTSFFENSDSDEESSSSSPPASLAPPSGRGRKVAVGKPTKVSPTKQPSPPSTGKRSFKKKTASPSPAATPSSTSKKKSAPSSYAVSTPQDAATPLPCSSQAERKKKTQDGDPTPASQAAATCSSPKSVSKPVAVEPAHVVPKPQIVVGTLPHVTSFSLQFPNVGIPFLLSTHHCGVRFNDGSCIMSAVSASVPTPTVETAAGDAGTPAQHQQSGAVSQGVCSGKKRARDAAADLPANTVIYINRHRHRFSVRPAVAVADNLTKLVVPSPLERKFMALLWCKDVVSSLHKRAQFGFVQGGSALMTVAPDMVDLSSVMEGAVDVADFPLPLYISDAQINAAGTSVTFQISNRSSVYPDRCYYPSDDEAPDD